MKTLNKYFPTILILVLMFGLSAATQTSALFTETLALSSVGFYFSLSLLLLVAVSMSHIEKYVTMPMFVWATLFGMALHVPFQYLISDMNALTVLIELFAAFILFAAGVTVPVKNFKKYFAPIATLSLFGTILTVFIFAIVLSAITAMFGINVSAISLLLLAAILSSIDPTTVLPTIEHLHFKRPFLKDIAVSESAINDVVGMIITRFFLVAALGATVTTSHLTSISSEFSTLFTRTALDFFAVVVIWGIMVGFLGGWILRTWGEATGKKHWSDPALFISIPILCYALGSIIPGAGFLAAFVAGLVYEVHHRASESHLFYESMVDRLLRPTVFILLGALVPLATLSHPIVILIGSFAAVTFMFVVRPLVVYISLLPWMITKRTHLNWREVLFLSFIRETGAVAAILMLYVFASGFSDVNLIFSIGVWVMLYTLIIEPPLTPLLAKRLEITN